MITLGGDKWTPKKLPTLRLWLAADNLGTITKDVSNYVSAWNDQTGSGISFSQGTGSKQPLWVSSGYGSKSKPYIQFDGVDDMLVYTGTLPSDTQGAVCLVVNHQTANPISLSYMASSDTATDNFTLQFGVYNVANITRLTVSNIQSGTTSRICSSSPNITSNIPRILIYVSSGTNYKLFQQSTDCTEVTNTGTDDGDWFGDISGLDNVVIGGNKRNTVTYSNIRIAEVIVMGTEPTTNELDYMNRYLNSKYGVY